MVSLAAGAEVVAHIILAPILEQHPAGQEEVVQGAK
jgi:hypothetical protein